MRCPECRRPSLPAVYVACGHAFCHACVRDLPDCPACADPASVMARLPLPRPL